MSQLSHTIKTLGNRNLNSYTAQMRPLVLGEAVALYISRRDRQSHPEGTFDKQSRWYPSTEERCDCCASIRTPSAAYPYSYLVHCRTAEHIASLFGISLDDLSAAIRRAEDRGGDEAKAYKQWLKNRAHLSPFVDWSGEGKATPKSR
jgi:hypothetical protein